LNQDLTKFRLRILVVDDNRDNADSCTMMLQLDGHDVRTAYSGSEGLKIAAEFKPHVMLLDIVMPEMSGYEVARKVRAAAWGKDIVLVAITGHGQIEDRRKALDAGFNHHFAKPIGLDQLKPILAEFAATQRTAGKKK
jgi:CheY-like chemotaxis protein